MSFAEELLEFGVMAFDPTQKPGPRNTTFSSSITHLHDQIEYIALTGSGDRGRAGLGYTGETAEEVEERGDAAPESPPKKRKLYKDTLRFGELDEEETR